MYGEFKQHLHSELQATREAGLYKNEREITTAQGSHIGVPSGDVINLCANNYLGLAQHPQVQQAALQGLQQWGYGMASVRFICGTQSIHKALEQKLSAFLGMPSTILYPSCFDANGGLFETLLTEQDAVISDALNHASIIDGIRLCKAKRYRFNNNDMDSLEQQLKQADENGARFKLISSDGVFSMDGTIAQVDTICDLAEKYNALVHIDECHATGFIGESGKGTHEYRRCMGRVDIITGTLGKALGGASGGFTSAHDEIVDMLRQRSRPYLFSNTVAPAVVAGAIKALDIAEQGQDLRAQLQDNMHFFRQQMTQAGFELLPGEHPIIPVMLHDAALASRFADAMLAKGVYVIAFSYPVVPKGQARIRTQISAAHSREDLAKAVQAFIDVKAELGV